ncbi:MAG: ATP-binding protein [Pseudomonadota bacterium]
MSRLNQPLSDVATRGGWFQILFVLAAIVSATATFIALGRTDPSTPTPAGVQGLLYVNLILLVLLSWLIVQRYRRLSQANAGQGGGRLARRYMVFFGLAAMIPAVLVSLFLWATLSRGVDSLFGDRVVDLMEQVATIADDSITEFAEVFEADTRLMAVDVNNAAEGYFTDRERFEEYLGIQAFVRNMPAAYILDRSGVPVAEGQNLTGTGFLRLPNRETLDDADVSGVTIAFEEQSGFAFSVIPLSEITGAYLYLAKPLDQTTVANLRRAEAALADYRQATQRSSRIQTLFFIAYLQMVALAVILSLRFGQGLAARISSPITRLADAAGRVSQGEAGVVVTLPERNDEIRALSESFNEMTGQLDDRRLDLTQAREDAETRRRFVETLLRELSAGVIQTNAAGEIVLANRSAGRLLSLDAPEGLALSEAAPALAEAIDGGVFRENTLQTSLVLTDGGEPRHIQLTVTRDQTGALVMTFDDATRLVAAQRQLAWRDVARRVAHEIRNPLTPIQLSTERLRRRFLPQLEDSDGVFARCIDTITRQVSEIGNMVQEFSDFARMPKPVHQRFDLADVIEDIAFSQQVVNPELAIAVHGTEKPVYFTGDERLIGQAIGNVVRNAAQELRQRPADMDTTGRIQIDLIGQGNGDSLVLSVSDNGPGFPSDIRERVLEPYVSARPGGTGLGLAIVNRIIIDHGGQIEISPSDASVLGGATLRLVLPLSPLIDDENALPVTSISPELPTDH